MTNFNEMQSQLDQLDQNVTEASSVLATFNSEMGKLQSSVAQTGFEIKGLERGLSSELKRAVDGLVLDGAKLSDVVKGVAQSVSQMAYNAAVKPVTDHVGGLLGNGLNSLLGNVMPFAKGGVLDGPAAFPMRSGIGVMGEAGPEAIMPLSRGADGKLGVKAAGGGAVNVTMNISTPDAQSFQRSQSQIANQMRRALSTGQRNQ